MLNLTPPRHTPTLPVERWRRAEPWLGEMREPSPAAETPAKPRGSRACAQARSGWRAEPCRSKRWDVRRTQIQLRRRAASVMRKNRLLWERKSPCSGSKIPCQLRSPELCQFSSIDLLLRRRRAKRRPDPGAAKEPGSSQLRRAPIAQLSRKLLSFRLRLGCLSLRKALASIWRMRSRVTENC